MSLFLSARLHFVCIHVFDLRSLYIRLGVSMEKLLFCRLTELNCLLVLQLICIEEENDHFSYLERTLSIAVLSDILSRCELNPVDNYCRHLSEPDCQPSEQRAPSSD